MRISKKILAAVLAALMAISMMPFTALAATKTVASVTELEQAIATASAGDTVKLLQDVDFTVYPAFTRHTLDLTGVTLDLDGHTITGYNHSVVYVGDNFTIKNGNMVCVYDSVNNKKESYAAVIYPQVGNWQTDVVTDKSTGVVLENLVLTGGINCFGADVTVRGKNTNVTGNYYYALWADVLATLTVEDGTFTSAASSTNGIIGACSDAGKEAYVYISGGDYTVPAEKNLVLLSTTASSQQLVEISGGTFTQSGAAYTVPAKCLAEGATQENGVVTTYVAEVNGVKYETFEAALAAISNVTTAKHSKAVDPTYDYKTYVANGEIKLLADCTSNGIIIGSGSNLVVDLNGHTLDINAKPVGSNGTESIALQFLKDSNITFKNGTLTSSYTYASTNKEHIQRLIQNYANLTFDDVDVTFKGNFKNQATISHCNGNLVLKGGSTLAAPDFSRFNYTAEQAATNLGAIAAFVGTFSTYTGASATVDEGSAITGNVKVQVLNPETALSNTLTLTSGSINGDIVMGDNADKAEVTKADTFTQDAPEGYEWVAGETTGTQELVKDTHSVAKVNGTKYDTLEAAITAANAGDTITLLSDVAVASTIVVNDGKNFTIDTNGNTISSTKRVFEIRHGGVTLTGDGTVSTTAISAIAVYGSTNSNDADYATFTLGADTTISAPNGYGAMIGENNKAAYGAKLTLNGTINSKYGVYVNGNVQEPEDKTNAAQVTINGTVTAGNEDAAVYAAGYAKWTVNEGSAISGGSGIYIKSGDLAVNGGTITATGTKTAYAFNPNGANGTGDAIIIDSCGYPGNVPTVAINGGTISSTYGDAVASYTKQDDPRYPDAEFEKVTYVIPATSTAVFSSDVSELAEEGYVTNYDAAKGGYVIGVDTAVDTMSITVEESVDLNIYVADPADEIETVEFTYNSTPNKESNTPVTKTVPATKNADGKIALKVDLAPAQIKDEITVVAKDENGVAKKQFTTSVADYCNTIINGNFDENLKDLAKATLDYGKAAANYFSYNASAYTDANYLAAPTFNASDYEDNSADLPIASVSYVATSVPELRFYIDPAYSREFTDIGARFNETIESNIGTAKFVKLEGTNQIILQIKNIPITDFGKQIIVTYNDGYEDKPILKYTPIKWVIAAQNVSELSALANGIGNYYAKSAAYFEA